MIKEKTYYDIICDRCGKSLTNESGDCYPDTNSAEMVALQSEWGRIGNIHLCPECFEEIKKHPQHTIQGTSTNPDPWKFEIIRKEVINDLREKKIVDKIHCGECIEMLYEDADGYGICRKTNEQCYCGDWCHLKYGKP